MGISYIIILINKNIASITEISNNSRVTSISIGYSSNSYYYPSPFWKLLLQKQSKPNKYSRKSFLII